MSMLRPPAWILASLSDNSPLAPVSPDPHLVGQAMHGYSDTLRPRESGSQLLTRDEYESLPSSPGGPDGIILHGVYDEVSTRRM